MTFYEVGLFTVSRKGCWVSTRGTPNRKALKEPQEGLEIALEVPWLWADRVFAGGFRV